MAMISFSTSKQLLSLVCSLGISLVPENTKQAKQASNVPLLCFTYM